MRLENRQGLALTGFYPNSNGYGRNVSGLIKFSKNSWFAFETKEEALNFINKMIKGIDKIVVDDINLKNIKKAKKIISQLVLRNGLSNSERIILDKTLDELYKK